MAQIGDHKLDLGTSEALQLLNEYSTQLFKNDLTLLTQRLNRVWQSNERIATLYLEIGHFSQTRASVNQIIQSAQEIATAQDVIQNELISSQEAKNFSDKVHQLRSILEHYETLLAQLY